MSETLPPIKTMRNTVFDNLILEDTIRDFKVPYGGIPIDEEAFFAWFSLIKSQDEMLVKETKGYTAFQDLVLSRMLGYAHDSMQSNVGTTRTVEFALGKPNTIPICVVELKGLGTDLFKPQIHRKKAESPADQARSYARNQGAPYCLVSDYDHFVFFPFSAPDDQYIEIVFENLFVETTQSAFSIDEFRSKASEDARMQYLREHFELDHDYVTAFLVLFHQSSFLEYRRIDSYRQTTYQRRNAISDKFYSLFNSTRLQLIWEIQSQNARLDMKQIIHLAQLILNRWLFVCFAESRKETLLPRGTSHTALLDVILSNRLSEFENDILKRSLDVLWARLSQGDPKLKIFGYNGGLFVEPLDIIAIRDWIKPTDLKKLAKEIGQPELNSLKKTMHDFFDNNDELAKRFNDLYSSNVIIHPLYLNLIRISQYDFATDISIEILGHVFEQSVSDIEALLKQPKKIGQRKKQGIYYTPSFITDYIVRNSINSYLLGEIGLSMENPHTRIQDVINAYLESSTIDFLEDKISSIKILDPACGSGAFLCKAVDVLLEFHSRVKQVKEHIMVQRAHEMKPKTKKKSKDNTVQVELPGYLSDLTNKVLLHNIFGVDLSPESVEITRLSLYLKIIDQEKHKLPILDNCIQVGNSLISNSAIDKLAFDWNSRFSVSEFNVVVGNPPYVRIHNLDRNTKDALEPLYEKAIGKGNYDLYLPFIFKGYDLLSEGGILGYIIPNKFYILEYGSTLRQFLSEENAVSSIVDFTWEQVFAGPTTYSSLIFLKKGLNQKGIWYQRVLNLDEWKNNPYDFKINRAAKIPHPMGDKWYLFFDAEQKLISSMSHGSFLGSMGSIFQGVTTGADDVYVLQHQSSDTSTQRLYSKQLDKQGEISTVDLENALLRPLLKGSEISRYCELVTQNRILFPYTVNNINNRPTLEKLSEEELESKFSKAHKYLKQCKRKLDSRGGAENLPSNKWFLYTYEKSLIKYGLQKLIWQVLSSRNNFTLDSNGEFVFVGGATAGGQGFVLDKQKNKKPTEDDYLELLAILNSKPIDLFIKLHSSKFRGGYFAYGKGFTKNVPVIRNSTYRTHLIQYAKALLESKKRIRTKQTEFDGWLALRIPLPKSFSIMNVLHLNEQEFRVYVSSHNKSGSPKQLGEIVRQFRVYKEEILKIHREIFDYEDKINDAIIRLYGLDKTIPGKNITFKEFIDSHPFNSS